MHHAPPIAYRPPPPLPALREGRRQIRAWAVPTIKSAALAAFAVVVVVAVHRVVVGTLAIHPLAAGSSAPPTSPSAWWLRGSRRGRRTTCAFEAALGMPPQSLPASPDASPACRGGLILTQGRRRPTPRRAARRPRDAKWRQRHWRRRRRWGQQPLLRPLQRRPP